MKPFKYILILIFISVVQAQKSDFKHINFDKADSIAHAYQGTSLKNLPLLTYQLTGALDTQVEQFRAIFTWVCFNIESDHDFGETTLRKRKTLKNDSLSFSNWNKQVLPKVFSRLLKNNKTICSGYAYLIKELSNLAGIDCKIVNGYSRNTKRNVGKVDFPNHSWNAVMLDEKWYLVDATLASGYFDLNTYNFVKNYNDGYFLSAPDLFLKRNFPLKASWMLTSNAPSLDEFVNAPIVYGKTFKHAVIPIAPKVLITNIPIGETLAFKFRMTDQVPLELVKLKIHTGFKTQRIEIDSNKINQGLTEIKYRFTKKGLYNVHLIIDKDIVASYTVRVKK